MMRPNVIAFKIQVQPVYYRLGRFRKRAFSFRHQQGRDQFPTQSDQRRAFGFVPVRAFNTGDRLKAWNADGECS